jgi:predicted metalloprotease with PDZ domain
VARAGLSTREEFLAALSGQIRSLQNAPGRLLQSLEESSLGVWENSLSGVGASASTVSYYVKGQVAGFLLDARIRRLTGGARTFDDVMRLAYQRYGGERGFAPGEFEAVVGEVAGADLGAWFRSVIGSTEELDYTEALDWYGLRFSPEEAWKLEVRPDATPAQREHLQAWLAPAVR